MCDCFSHRLFDCYCTGVGCWLKYRSKSWFSHQNIAWNSDVFDCTLMWIRVKHDESVYRFLFYSWFLLMNRYQIYVYFFLLLLETLFVDHFFNQNKLKALKKDSCSCLFIRIRLTCLMMKCNKCDLYGTWKFNQKSISEFNLILDKESLYWW